MRHSREIPNSHVDFLVTEGNISDAHDRVASVNFIILITPKKNSQWPSVCLKTKF